MRRRTGFSLIEALIAVAIAGSALVVLMTGVSRCLMVMKKVQKYQQAQWAMGLGELEHPLTATNDVKSLEVSPEAYGTFYFSREVEEDEDKDKLYVVRSRVTWDVEGKQFQEEVVRYVLERGGKNAK